MVEQEKQHSNLSAGEEKLKLRFLVLSQSRQDKCLAPIVLTEYLVLFST